MRGIKKSKENKRIAGVCQGIGNALGIDGTFIRLAFILMAILPPVPVLGAIVIYGFLAYILPTEDGFIDV